ncbi:PocR ligand-binding domain-containing protein [Zoogloea sp.]|uniref:PocR ligand-binding domain-containing protein n=1 Tax=Zoogloea sp. TaxID=49181 RepID=UPI0014157863|nr:MAG: PAS domain S-box protein [Zoogloea sp.]
MRFTELVDIDELRGLCEEFSDITGAVTAILDLEGNILIATGWQDICTKFHRVNPGTAARCLESDTILADQLKLGEDYNVYRCKNGLVDVAVPINIGGEHVANLFTGQFFFDKPDTQYFVRQADEFRFDQQAYLEALEKTPVFTAEKVKSTMAFFTRLARVIGEMGLARVQMLETNSALQASEAIIQSSEDAIIGKSLDGVITTWNPRATSIFGYTAAEMIGQSMLRLFPDALRHEEEEILDRIQRGEKVEHFESIRIRKDGEPINVSITISPIRNARGEIIGASTSARDITRQVSAETAAREKDEQFRLAIETSTDGFWITDTAGRILEVNNAYVKLSGYSRDELLGMSIEHLDASDSAERITALTDKVLADGYARFETTHRRRSGKVWPAEVVASYSPMMGGRLFVFIKDRTEEKKAAELIWRQANFDRLTDLPNRSLLFDRLSKACLLAQRQGRHAALLYLDLDGFKPINDRFGHETGDIVLAAVAKRWVGCVRESDTVARLGGDEFAVLTGDLIEQGEAASVARKLLDALAAPIPLPGGKLCHIGASVGISMYPDNALEIDSLIEAADWAMYQSKARGKNTYTFSSAHPEPRQWVSFDDTCLVGVAEIDAHHRQLAHMINSLNQATRLEASASDFLPRFKDLIDFVRFHLDAEDRLMKEYDYPDHATHRHDHDDLLHLLERTALDFRRGKELLALQVVKDLFVNHIKTSDKPLGSFLNGLDVS